MVGPKGEKLAVRDMASQHVCGELPGDVATVPLNCLLTSRKRWGGKEGVSLGKLGKRARSLRRTFGCRSSESPEFERPRVMHTIMIPKGPPFETSGPDESTKAVPFMLAGIRCSDTVGTVRRLCFLSVEPGRLLACRIV